MSELKESMASARLLLSNKPAEAVALLEQARLDADRVPASFEILAAQAYVATGQASRAIDVLQACCEAGRATQAVHIALGNVLRTAGRREEAMAQFQAALESTADDETTSGRVSMRESVAYDSGHRALLVYVPKVACTILKATVVMNSPLRDRYQASSLGIHRFVGSTTPTADIEGLMSDPAVFRWTVLREPTRRLLSAYLNKFVGSGKNVVNRFYKLKAIKKAQSLAGVPFDPERSITFEEFVRYLMVTDDSELNVHWLPQFCIVGQDLGRFAHVGRLEHLDATFEVLARRFNYEPERDAVPHLGGARQHSTRFKSESWLAEPFRQLPRRLRSKEGFPPAESFFTPELRALILERYAEDARLYASTGA